MKEEIKCFLEEKLLLQLSVEKTLVTDVKDGFTFLGYEFRRAMGQKGMTVKMEIPKEAVAKVKEKITEAVKPHTLQDNEDKIAENLNRTLRGWGHYYKYTSHSGKEFSRIQHYAFWKFAHWLADKHKRRHMSAILKPLEKRGRTIIVDEVKTLCGIGKRGRIVPLTHLSGIKGRRLDKKFVKPNPYLCMPQQK